MAIAFFYAVGTAAGGITGPLLFGVLIASGKRADMAIGYLIGAALMIAAGLVEVCLGVNAEQKPLEEIATPLTAEAAGEHRADHHRRGHAGCGRNGAGPPCPPAQQAVSQQA